MERHFFWRSTRSAFFVWEIIVLTAIATLSKPLQLAKHGMDLWRRRRLSSAFAEAQAALGERMYAAGIDDGELGARISALDEQLYWAESVGGSIKPLKAARLQLVLQLAAAALEDDGPLPGADAEYRRASEAQAALDRHDKEAETRLTARLWGLDAQPVFAAQFVGGHFSLVGMFGR